MTKYAIARSIVTGTYANSLHSRRLQLEGRIMSATGHPDSKELPFSTAPRGNEPAVGPILPHNLSFLLHVCAVSCFPGVC